MKTDWEFLWAAYRMEFFSEWLPGDLTQFDFRDRIEELFRQHEFYVFSGLRKGAVVPIGMATVDREFHRIEPQVDWFSWATPLNKLETMLRFIEDMRATNLVVFFADVETHKLCKHLARYGVLKGPKNVDNWFGFGHMAKFWQSI